MQECVTQFIRGCILYCKLINEKQGLYHSLPTPTVPYESISINFVGGFPRTKKGRDYLFLAVDKFINMCIPMPCKRTIKGQDTINMFFKKVWVQFDIPRSIVSNRDTKFLSYFGLHFGIRWKPH